MLSENLGRNFVFPVENKKLEEILELLHRMTVCQSTEPFQWMAWDAIDKLRSYVSSEAAI